MIVNGIEYIPGLGVASISYDGYTFDMLIDGSDKLEIKNVTKTFKKDGQGKIETERLLRREVSLKISSYYSEELKTRFLTPTRGKQLHISNGTSTIIIDNVDAIIDSITLENALAGKNVIVVRFDCRDTFPDIKII